MIEKRGIGEGKGIVRKGMDRRREGEGWKERDRRSEGEGSKGKRQEKGTSKSCKITRYLYRNFIVSLRDGFASFLSFFYRRMSARKWTISPRVLAVRTASKFLAENGLVF